MRTNIECSSYRGPPNRVSKKRTRKLGVKPNLGVRLTIPILEQVMARLIKYIDEILSWCYIQIKPFRQNFCIALSIP